MISEKDAKQAVLDAAKMLLREKLVARTWGNVSCRTGKQSYVITPSGLSYEKMKAEDMASYNMATSEWECSRKPSSERGVHSAAYSAFPEAGFVIHTHQTYASALGLGGFEALRLNDSQKAALGGIAVAQYALPGTKKLSKNAAEAFARGANVVLLKNHGAVIVAENKDEAFERAKLLEAICKDAAKGQPEESSLIRQPGRLEKLAEQTAPSFPYVSYSFAPAVIEVSNSVSYFRAQLDDMAQMIGTKLITVESSLSAVAEGLKKHNAVLVKGLGAVCRADSQGDCDALKLLVEKACVCYLHTRALGIRPALSAFDTTLMRIVYKSKYSKKSED
mgnify:CR=1 FL=1